MSVTFETLAGIIRVYNESGDSDVSGKPFKAVITTLIDDKEATLKGALGELTRKDMIEITQCLRKQGVETIKMKRASGHSLPGCIKVSEKDGFSTWVFKVNE